MQNFLNNISFLIDHSNGQYPILVGESILNNITSLIKGTQALIVTDENVAPHYLAAIQNQLQNMSCGTLILPAGEEHKTIQTFNKIIDACALHQHHRDTTLIALGGGVISDMTGFAAACYHRGVSWIAIPTTLLAQVDASIGGKTAVNHIMGKNLIGAFHPPIAVLIDVFTLTTLPDREFRAGIAEIIKAALIRDASFFAWLEKNMSKLIARDKETLFYAIKRSIKIKRDIVIQDEKEKNDRMLLNFGHTFAHAIEKNAGFGHWLHGEAVAYGMLAASVLSHQKKRLNQTAFDRIRNLLTQFGFINRLPNHFSLEDLTNTMRSDKKVKSNLLQLILLEKIGGAIIADDVTSIEMMAAWKAVQGTGTE